MTEFAHDLVGNERPDFVRNPEEIWAAVPREHPILFSGKMVQAILEGRKTQTRRLVTPRTVSKDGSPRVRAGDLLWVRETWNKEGGLVSYLADGDWIADFKRDDPNGFAWYRGKLRWKPSIHMPRWASRIDLRVKSSIIHRLTSIRDADAKTEGVGPDESGGHIGPFRRLWDEINGKRAPWGSDPLVVAIEFEVIEQ